jgi:hypothetical protein
MKKLLRVQDWFWKQDRRIYYFNGEDGESKVGGYYQEYRNFTMITVPKSGHFIPATYYRASKSILDDFVNWGGLQCYDKAKHCRVTSDMCSFMNNCNGNGVCQANGQCRCTPGFKGADCSYKAIVHPKDGRSQVTTNGTEWFYYVHQPARWQDREEMWKIQMKSTLK